MEEPGFLMNTVIWSKGRIPDRCTSGGKLISALFTHAFVVFMLVVLPLWILSGSLCASGGFIIRFAW